VGGVETRIDTERKNDRSVRSLRSVRSVKSSHCSALIEPHAIAFVEKRCQKSSA